MAAPSHREHTEPPLPLFFLTLVASLSALLAALRLFAPEIWAQQLHSLPWKGVVAFLIISWANCLVEYYFHRNVLHSPAIPFLAHLYRQHASHHALTHLIRKETPAGHGLLFLQNKLPPVKPSRSASAFFRRYSLMGFALALSPLLACLQWLLPSFPWFFAGFAALAVSLSFYEILYVINHWSVERWSQLMEHPRWGKLWHSIHSFQLGHVAMPECNQSISGFFGLPLADWTFGTCMIPQTIHAEGEGYIQDLRSTPRPRWFIRGLDKWIHRIVQRRDASTQLAPRVEGLVEKPVASRTHQFTPGEEIANWVTHGIGLVLSVAGLALLIVFSTLRGDLWHVSSFTVFGLTLLALYAASTIYHAHKGGRKLLLRKLDHAAIFLLIAGTYTPFLLTSLRGPWGWTLFGVIWGICGVGAMVKVFASERYGLASTLAYLFAGWLIVVALKPLVASVPYGGLKLLVAGGLCYTFGVVFFLWQKLRYHHAVWHLFVLAGSTCHYLAVILFLLPVKT